MKIGDRVEVTRTYFARNEACTNWGRACFPTQGIVEFVSNRWVTLMMISPKDSKKNCIGNHFGEDKYGLYLPKSSDFERRKS